jgi:glucosamine-phosphate N-acetyltransferase
MTEIRKLEYNDYHKGFLDLINTFTRNPVCKPNFEEFCKMMNTIVGQGSIVYVVEDEKEGKIISSIKCLIEQKMHNNFKRVMHIEDLVTHSEYRKQGLASKLLKKALEVAKELNCYKVVLCSNPENKEFYLNNGFLEKGIEFTKYTGV